MTANNDWNKCGNSGDVLWIGSVTKQEWGAPRLNYSAIPWALKCHYRGKSVTLGSHEHKILQKDTKASFNYQHNDTKDEHLK